MSGHARRASKVRYAGRPALELRLRCNHRLHRRQADLLGTAKRLAHDLLGPGRVAVPGQGRRQVVVRSGEQREQALERREIAVVHGSRDRFLDEMIAGDDGRMAARIINMRSCGATVPSSPSRRRHCAAQPS